MEVNGINVSEIKYGPNEESGGSTLHLIEQNKHIEDIENASKLQQDTISELQREIRQIGNHK